ncbi:hypothetical protein ACFQ71_23520 [Streptomyces sp. NPDC056534]|uniref:hypothetical protein n=1 Tax=Streptomyces sp. NPDC056534 TaxID=3345857 RepID=UPI003689890B
MIEKDSSRATTALELSLQELETLEAPGFTSGVKAGFEASMYVVTATVAVASAAAAIST